RWSFHTGRMAIAATTSRQAQQAETFSARLGAVCAVVRRGGSRAPRGWARSSLGVALESGPPLRLGHGLPRRISRGAGAVRCAAAGEPWGPPPERSAELDPRGRGARRGGALRVELGDLSERQDATGSVPPRR